jgi:hypothetical protein
MAFDQRGDLRMGTAHQQVTFPMPWDGSILDLGRALVDGEAFDDAGVPDGLSARPAHEAGAPEVADELLLKDVARLYEQAPVERLVRHPHRAIMRECVLEANGDLAWRPIAA